MLSGMWRKNVVRKACSSTGMSSRQVSRTISPAMVTAAAEGKSPINTGATAEFNLRLLNKALRFSWAFFSSPRASSNPWITKIA